MTYSIFDGDTIAVGDAFTLATGDALQTLAGSVLASSAGAGIYATGSVNIDVAGAAGGLLGGVWDFTGLGDTSTTISVEATGYLFAGPGGNRNGQTAPAAIAVFGYGANTTIINSGVLVANEGDGVLLQSASATTGLIVNNVGGSITGLVGIDVESGSGAVTETVNYGTIVGTQYAYYDVGQDQETLDNQGVMIGQVEIAFPNPNNRFYNAGTMDFTNAQANIGLYAAGLGVVNFGLMYQNVVGARYILPGQPLATAMIDIDTYSGGYVYNGGTIAQVLGAAANSGDTVISFDNGLASSFVDNLASGKIYGDIYLGNGQGVYLANAGQIFGNISFGNRQSDYVSNTGQIFGNVLLGAGQGDAYYGAQGKLSGTIVCGGYNDTVFTGADFETVVAGAGYDTFNMATGGETIISETLAQQRLDGWDVVSNFQSYNPAPRQGTFLQIDPALAASTSFVAYGGGTLVEMALGGGNYAFVDVLGASVAAVQGQTYFA